MTDDKPAPPKTINLKVCVAALIAIAYFAIWGLLLWEFGLGGKPPFGLSVAGANWDHTLALFNALSAIAAAAVGVLLGTKVEQAKTEAAKKDTEAAKKDTAEATGWIRSLSIAGKAALREKRDSATQTVDPAAELHLRAALPPAQDDLHEAIVQADAWLKRRSASP